MLGKRIAVVSAAIFVLAGAASIKLDAGGRGYLRVLGGTPLRFLFVVAEEKRP